MNRGNHCLVDVMQSAVGGPLDSYLSSSARILCGTLCVYNISVIFNTGDSYGIISDSVLCNISR